MTTKQDLIKQIHYRLGHSEAKTKESVDEICKFMASSLQKHERIEIRGFFSFAIRNRKTGRVRNPKTGEILVKGAKDYVHGKQSKSWMREMNGIVSAKSK